MREMLALLRASWLSAASYRMGMLMSIAGLVVAVLPTYFVAGAIQPVIADRISTEGGHYFGFLIVGMVSFSFLTTSVNAIAGAVGSGIGTGTLEAMLATRARLPALLGGLVSYAFAWTAVRAALTIILATLLGVRLSAEQSGLALAILGLIVVAYFGVGLMAAALVLAFRTTGPFPQAVLLASGLLGGVYYPTSVIPSWLQALSDVVPLTYGLRALRQAWLEGMPLSDVAGDVAVLAAMAVVLFAAGGAVFGAALRHARRAGTLAHY